MLLNCEEEKTSGNIPAHIYRLSGDITAQQNNKKMNQKWPVELSMCKPPNRLVGASI